MVRIVAIAAVGSLCACGGGSSGFSAVPQSAQRLVGNFHRDASNGKIRHVVIIIQENRSFNNLFYGFPGAHTVKFGYNSFGKKIILRPLGLATSWDLAHDSQGFLAACNGRGKIPGTHCRMNGFNKEWVGCGTGSGLPRCPHPNPQYSFVPRHDVEPYFWMGMHYVLADQMYASNFDASSFVSHQYLRAGQASSTVNFPSTTWGCPGGRGDTIDTLSQKRKIGNPREACLDGTTIGDEMDTVGLPWGFYTATVDGDGNLWSAYQAIKHIYDGPDWKKDIFTPQTQFFDDVYGAKLPALSWVTPTYENSDHAANDSNTGPSWVASLVNAIGESAYWDSTAIFVLWDDYGGWYDPAAPKMLDYDGLGMRLPLLIISPYAKQGYVSHVPYEHGSILKFVEDTFGLPRLAASDTRANSPASDAFDFTKPPRKFVKIPSSYDTNYFLHQPPDTRPPDDN